MLEAIAQYDFTARSSREVSFMKGDLITLYSQVSITVIIIINDHRESPLSLMIIICRPVLTGGEAVWEAEKV